MKTKTHLPAASMESSTEADIRDYAYHLYVQNGSNPNQEIDNWLEAKACLDASIPKSESRTRLHLHSRKAAEHLATA